jgi:hypothetical protein
VSNKSAKLNPAPSCKERILTTGKHHLLPLSTLAALNAQMAQPLELRLKRPQQKSYPHLNGCYILARAAGLLRLEQAKTGTRLVLDAAALDSWAVLNLTERYFALLEAWLLRASLETIGERARWGSGMRNDRLTLWQRVPERGLKLDKREQTSLPYFGGLHNLAMLELFGLLRVTHGDPQPDSGRPLDDGACFSHELRRIRRKFNRRTTANRPFALSHRALVRRKRPMGHGARDRTRP